MLLKRHMLENYERENIFTIDNNQTAMKLLKDIIECHGSFFDDVDNMNSILKMIHRSCILLMQECAFNTIGAASKDLNFIFTVPFVDKSINDEGKKFVFVNNLNKFTYHEFSNIRYRDQVENFIPIARSRIDLHHIKIPREYDLPDKYSFPLYTIKCEDRIIIYVLTLDDDYMTDEKWLSVCISIIENCLFYIFDIQNVQYDYAQINFAPFLVFEDNLSINDAYFAAYYYAITIHLLNCIGFDMKMIEKFIRLEMEVLFGVTEDKHRLKNILESFFDPYGITDDTITNFVIEVIRNEYTFYKPE